MSREHGADDREPIPGLKGAQKANRADGGRTEGRKVKNPRQDRSPDEGSNVNYLAERGRFELPVRFTAHRFSRAAP